MTTMRPVTGFLVRLWLVILTLTPAPALWGQTNVAIHDIQGNGLASPMQDQVVTTTGIVTAVAPAGFFLQTPDDEADTDPDTSEGIYVYTGSAPVVSVGDRVQVTGTVSEYFDLTEIGAPEMTVLTAGNPLPDPVVFDDDTPSGKQPRSPVEMERFEGMLIAMTGGWVCSGSNGYGEVYVAATTNRPVREPGIIYPGEPGLPIWDGNPEIFTMKPEALGLSVGELVGGTRIVSATGPLTFAFGEYALWPTQLTLDSHTYPQEPRDRQAGEVVVASQNLHQLGDTATDRFAKLSLGIRTLFRKPDILAAQEARNTAALQGLADRIHTDDPSLVYTVFFNDDSNGTGTGFLVRDTVTVDAVNAVQVQDSFDFDGSTYTLHDRPPYLLEGTVTAGGSPVSIAVLNVHIRSMIDVDTKPWVREKRNQQARHIADFIQDYQTLHPDRALFVIGDFNAFPFTDGYVDVTGTIAGNPDPRGAMVPAEDLVDPDLVNLINQVPETSRYSFVQNGTAQVLDQALGTVAAADLVRDVAFVHAGADAPDGHENDPADPIGLSDHDGLLLFLAPQQDPVVDSVTVDPDGTIHVTAHDPDGGGIRWVHWRITGPDTVSGRSSTLDFTPAYRAGGAFTISIAVTDDEDATSNWTDTVATISVDTHCVRPLPTEPVMTPYRVTTWILNPEPDPVQVTIQSRSGTKAASADIPGGGKLNVGSLDGLPDPEDGRVVDMPLRLPVVVELASDTARMSVPLAPASRDSLVIPHIAESTGYWNTTAFLSNATGTSSTVTVGAAQQDLTDMAAQLDVESLLPDPPVEATAWGTVSSGEAALSGFELFVKEGNDGAGTGLPAQGANFLYIPHIPTNTDIFWTGFAVVNMGDETGTAIFRFYGDDGTPLGDTTLTIPANTKIKGLMTGLFPDVAGIAGWGTITCDQPLAAIEIYGTYHAGICGFALPDHAGTDLVLPVMLTGEGLWTGVAFINPSDTAAAVTIRLVAADGSVKAKKQETVAAESRFKFVAGDYFSGASLENGDTIRLLSSVPLAAMEATGDLDRTFMTAVTGLR